LPTVKLLTSYTSLDQHSLAGPLIPEGSPADHYGIDGGILLSQPSGEGFEKTPWAHAILADAGLRQSRAHYQGSIMAREE
jgi:hypothetical protein